MTENDLTKVDTDHTPTPPGVSQDAYSADNIKVLEGLEAGSR